MVCWRTLRTIIGGRHANTETRRTRANEREENGALRGSGLRRAISVVSSFLPISFRRGGPVRSFRARKKWIFTPCWLNRSLKGKLIDFLLFKFISKIAKSLGRTRVYKKIRKEKYLRFFLDKARSLLGRIFEEDSCFVGRRKEPRSKRKRLIYSAKCEESKREEGIDWRQERRMRSRKIIKKFEKTDGREKT